MSKEQTEEEKEPTLWDKNRNKILNVILLPLLIGTLGRLVIFLMENMPLIIRWFDQLRLAFVDFLKQLMLDSPLCWLIINLIGNWIIGIGIICGIFIIVMVDT